MPKFHLPHRGARIDQSFRCSYDKRILVIVINHVKPCIVKSLGMLKQIGTGLLKNSGGKPACRNQRASRGRVSGLYLGHISHGRGADKPQKCPIVCKRRFVTDYRCGLEMLHEVRLRRRRYALPRRLQVHPGGRSHRRYRPRAVLPRQRSSPGVAEIDNNQVPTEQNHARANLC